MTNPSDAVLASWCPPVSFPMQIWYGQRRRPVQLWTFPAQVDDQGRVLLYLAGGPAGTPIMTSRITGILHPPLPDYARVRVIIERAPDGQLVFGKISHTVN